MLNKNEYDDFLIIDKYGVVVFADLGDSQYFDKAPEQWRGEPLKDIFIGIDENYPALRSAIKGEGIEHFEIEVKTDKGVSFKKVGACFPIYKEGESVASVEFSSIVYDKERVRDILKYKDNYLYRHNGTMYTIESIKTENQKMKEIKSEIEKIAVSDASVLIYGKTGTGKELAAQAIHNCSRRYYKKFVSLNCGTIPEGLAEGIIFGTTEGSFTGAEDKEGVFEMAAGGTLFLDEINSLKPQMQTKLLRAIETKEIRRIGAVKDKYVDVRIIAATNEDPETLIENGRMKADFFHRISAIYLKLPKLEDRGDDVLVLAKHFMDYFNKKTTGKIKGIDDNVRKMFLQYDWPGNVRELRNVIEGAFAFAESDIITIEDMPEYILVRMTDEEAVLKSKVNESGKGKLRKEALQLERDLIDIAIEESDGSLTKAADKLGISKQLLRYKIGKHNMPGGDIR